SEGSSTCCSACPAAARRRDVAAGPLILLTNDDGHRAAGLLALRQRLSRMGRVVTVAPASEMSGVSHAITLTRALTVEAIEADFFAVDGTPTDCVNIAVN